MTEELRSRVEKLLRKHGAIPEGGLVLVEPYGAHGARAIILKPEKKGRTSQVRSATAAKLTGCLRDQVNGLVGALLA